MPDISTISSALAALKTATDLATFFRSSNLNFQDAENKNKIADLVSALADVKMQLSDLKQLILDKDHVIAELQSQLEVRAKIKWEHPCYWIIEKDSKEGPYCQPCYDGTNRLVRLHNMNNGFWACKICKNSFAQSGRVLPTRADTDYDPFK